MLEVYEYGGRERGRVERKRMELAEWMGVVRVVLRERELLMSVWLNVCVMMASYVSTVFL